MLGGGGSNGNDTEEAMRQKSIEIALARHMMGSGHDDEDEDEDEDEEDFENENENNGKANKGEEDDSDDGDGNDDDDDNNNHQVGSSSFLPPQPPAARGKPEAMAARLASESRVQEKREELEQEVLVAATVVDGDNDDNDNDNHVADSVSMAAVDAPVDAVAVIDKDTKDGGGGNKTTSASASSGAAPKKKARRKPPVKKKVAAKAEPFVIYPTMDDPVPDAITDAQYENLDQMMVQFCRVPLLAEFSRPVSLLHPELLAVYSKIVEHPIDLGYVCRKVRKREYTNLRDIQLDAWRIFSNCVKYHSHASNKQAVPSFVSIALHLRSYFNALWQEYMMPSDPPPPSSSSSSSHKKMDATETHAKTAFARRQEERKRRLVVSGLSCMTGKAISRAAGTLGKLVEDGGCIDGLDEDPILNEEAIEDEGDLGIVKQNLLNLQGRLIELSQSDTDYGIDELERDVQKCYTDDILENNPVMRMKVAHRLDRWIGKIVVPIYEATCRGVSQSSIWGCMVAAVWARESSKKPFWPALVLGIMAPEHQKEEWHHELTMRNEGRLPEKLKVQLVTGKRRAEAALKKQKLGQMDPQSQFLVEFLGTHEFIWVREADIIEDFDPTEDPNLNVPPPSVGSKKKRASRSSIANIVGSEQYTGAKDEAKWALEEFEVQLQDIGVGNEAGEDEDDGYSFPVLCQSDDEADAADTVPNTDVDVEELNELLATDGIIDFTLSGRKNAKKRAQALKKQKIDAEKKQKADKLKKVKAEQNKKRKDAKEKEKETKKEQRDLERKRKKRTREREKALKSLEPSKKKPKIEPEDLMKRESGRRNLIARKQERAMAIVNGYINRSMERGDYTPLCLGGSGVMNIPAAMIDSTGLLGIALAMRAAAGEIPMPDESGDQNSNIKPWDKIDVDSKKTSLERMEFLRKQAKLMKEEIARLKINTDRRRDLTAKATAEIMGMKQKVVAGDVAARINPIEKKKTPSKSKEKKAQATKTSGDVTAASEIDTESHADTMGSRDGDEDVARSYADSSADEGMAESVEDNLDDGAVAVEEESDEEMDTNNDSTDRHQPLVLNFPYE